MVQGRVVDDVEDRARSSATSCTYGMRNSCGRLTPVGIIDEGIHRKHYASRPQEAHNHSDSTYPLDSELARYHSTSSCHPSSSRK